MLSTVSFFYRFGFLLSLAIECFFRTPKYVTGSNQAHLMWNYIGRQRVVKHLKESLAELGFRNSFFTNDSY